MVRWLKSPASTNGISTNAKLNKLTSILTVKLYENNIVASTITSTFMSL